MQAGGGIDNHLLLWDLTPLGLTGKVYDKVCEMCHITLNKTAIFGDNGTPAMRTRGCIESDFETIVDFLRKAAHITSALQRKFGKPHKELCYEMHASSYHRYIAAAQQGAKTNHRSIVYAVNEAYSAVKENMARGNQVKRA
ncbi:hypothetical protein Bca4012_087801 [Brassica carinata]